MTDLPERNISAHVLCPDMEELVLYIGCSDNFYVEHLSVTEGQVSRGAKLSSIRITDLSGFRVVSDKDVWQLREHVTHVE